MRRLALILLLGLVAASAAAWPPWGNQTGWNPGDGWRGPAGRDAAPTFDLNFADGSGPSLLSSALTVNGVSMTPLLDCDATDISGTDWPCDVGGTLAEVGVGSSPTAGQPTPFTDAAPRGVAGTLGKYYERAATIEVDTNDFVVELIVRAPNVFATEDTLLSVNYGASTAPILFVVSGTGLFTVYSNITNCVPPTVALAPGSWNHFLWFVRRGTNSILYQNGMLTGASPGSCSASDFDNLVAPLKIGAWGNTGTHNSVFNTSAVAVARVYSAGCSACLGAQAQWDPVARERASRLHGNYADIAAGSAAPTTATRASSAYVDIDRDGDGVRRLFAVGANWIRTARRPDTSAILRTGYLSEPQATNLFLRSQEFDNASWTKNDATISAGSYAFPAGTTFTDGIVGAANANVHEVTQTVVTTAVATTFSVFVRAGARSFVTLKGSVPAVERTFNISGGCAVGTNSGGTHTPFAESYGDGWCRVGMTFTGSAGSTVLTIRAANTTSDGTFTGNGSTVDLHVWGAQIESTGWPSSYILTTTATATRLQDILQYNDDSNASSLLGTMESVYQCDSYGSGLVAANLRIGGISDGGNNSIAFTDSGGLWGAFYYRAAVTQAMVGPATSGALVDGSLNTIRMIWGTDDVRYWFDGVAAGTPDTTATMIAEGTTTRIAFINNGATSSSASGPCVGTRMRIWPAKVTP
jgi:hypothetical protein